MGCFDSLKINSTKRFQYTGDHLLVSGHYNVYDPVDLNQVIMEQNNDSTEKIPQVKRAGNIFHSCNL